jgi:predicted amidohydrolase
MLETVRGAQTAVVALLWTWLELHLVELGSLVDKAPALLVRALEEGALAELDDAALKTIAEEPAAGAAVVLARLAQGLGDINRPIVDEVQGYLGEAVWVSWGGSELARRIGRGEGPPSAQEHPSLTTLAPNLRISPAMVGNYRLRVPRVDPGEWRLAEAMLVSGMARPEQPLEFHMATLGDQGLSEWWVDEELRVGALRAEEVSESEQDDAAEAFGAALEAAPANSILLLPELAATPVSLAAISARLAAREEGPALTVVGLYHGEAEGEEAQAGFAPYVNEAVVLGPAGGELWRQRKMSYAEDAVELDGRSVEVAEHIRLGDSLAVMPSPLGTIAVVICLDAFRRETRDRIERSPVRLMLVPSLSRRVYRHRDSLQQLVQALWGVACVCNRSPRTPAAGATRWNEDDNRSFCVAQREKAVELLCVEEAHTFVLRLDG